MQAYHLPASPGIAVIIALVVLHGNSNRAAATGTVASSIFPDYLPVGTIVPFTNTTNLPPGYLPCDGSGYFISSYPALFAVVGTTFVSQANRDAYSGYKFSVPDLRGVFPVGVGSNSVLSTTNRALGTFDGSESMTIGAANLPSHTHSGSTGFEVNGDTNTASNTFFFHGTGAIAYGSTGVFLAIQNHYHTFAGATCDNCGGAPLRSTPPAMGLHFIIKAGPAATPTPAPCPSMLPVPDASLNGTKVSASAANFPATNNPFVTDSEATCSQQCCAVPACAGYTFNSQLLLLGTGGAPCFLWSNVNGYVPTAGYTSGVSSALFSSSA